jgi:hypothetical protein
MALHSYPLTLVGLLAGSAEKRIQEISQLAAWSVANRKEITTFCNAHFPEQAKDVLREVRSRKGEIHWVCTESVARNSLLAVHSLIGNCPLTEIEDAEHDAPVLAHLLAIRQRHAS